MAKITIPTNWEDVPNQMVPVSVGIKKLEITKAEPGVSGTGGEKLVVEFRVLEEGKDFGRTLQDHISLKMLSRLKNLCVSAGVDPEGDSFETSDLEGQVVTGRIKHQVYTQPLTPEQVDAGEVAEPRTNARVAEYLDATGNAFKNA